MSRLIYAEYLLDLIKDIDSERFGYIDAEDINNAPTVDAVPVKHGHWIKIGSQYSIRNMKCSICGEEVFGDVDTEKYCFNCGAKMDEVTE